MSSSFGCFGLAMVLSVGVAVGVWRLLFDSIQSYDPKAKVCFVLVRIASLCFGLSEIFRESLNCLMDLWQQQFDAGGRLFFLSET